LTVDEGYAAVTQNNGKQHILPGGHTHLLDHKNWVFEKTITLKIQTDDLKKVVATSADNINMTVTSTVTWRVVDPLLAATMAADTMSVGGAQPSKGIEKIKQDVLKQAVASLAQFIGGVNYSDSFSMAAKNQGGAPAGQEASSDNPLYDPRRMQSAVAHANKTTMAYGVEIVSINILVAVPVDKELTRALSAGAVASAEALQSETAARGNAKAMRIASQATAQQARIAAQGDANAEVIRATAHAKSAELVAEGDKKAADMLAGSKVAVELAKIEKSAKALGASEKLFFGQEPACMATAVPKGSR